MDTLNPKSVKEKDNFDELKQQPCCFPVLGDEGDMKPCGQKQFMMISMPMANIGESGKPIVSESLGVALPFCNYHSYIIMEGSFAAITDAKGRVTGIQGPLEAVYVVETVLNAYLMAGKFQEIAKQMKTGELMARKSFDSIKGKDG